MARIKGFEIREAWVGRRVNVNTRQYIRGDQRENYQGGVNTLIRFLLPVNKDNTNGSRKGVGEDSERYQFYLDSSKSSCPLKALSREKKQR